MDRKQRLVDLIDRPGILIVPGAYDAITARLIERAGFEVCFATGAGISNAHLGLADVSLLTFDELLRVVTRMIEVTKIPLIVDADTGFGGPLNIQRTVRELERAGVSAIMLEDQLFPKRCGHFPGKKIAATAEMLARLSAALDARVDKRTLILARTDARASDGLQAAIDRVHRYFELGADIGFIEAPVSVEEMRTIGAAFKGKPLVINVVEGGKTPLLSAAELERLGFKIMFCANTVLRAMIKSVSDALQVLKQDGSQARVLGMICTWEERQNLVETNRLLALGSRYDQIAASK